MQHGGEWVKTTIGAFAEGGASCPWGNLILDQNENLYGASILGGTNDLGTVFKLTRQGSTWSFALLYSFQGGSTDGQSPRGGVVFDKAGNLYGTTVYGGNSSCQDGCGTVFQLTPSQGGNWTETVIHFFGQGHDGASPTAGLILDDKGNLFGTTAAGGTAGEGAVFKLDVPATQGGAWTEHMLYNFKGMPDGEGADSTLIFDPKGNLDGTTVDGGSANSGSVFQLVRGPGGDWTENVLYSFCSASKCADGASPVAGVILANEGKLYGTTYYGGSVGFGTVFQLAPPEAQGDPWTESVLWSFVNGKDGWGPRAGLTLGKFGVLYGTTFYGGNEGRTCTFNLGCGTVFKVRP
jgi:uncharacterized repeat protein (TIGR03803 family)